MMEQLLKIAITHTEDNCSGIKESSYIERKIYKTEEHEDLTDMIIANNDPTYELIPLSDRAIYLKQRRIEIGTEIEENKSLMSKYNFNNYLSIKKIQSGLMRMNSISSLIFLSEYYKCRITLIIPGEKIYYETPRNYKENLYIVKNKENWGLSSMKKEYIKCSLKDIDGLSKDIVSYEVYDIPLKNISSYTSKELQELAKDNCIDVKVNGKIRTKKDIYEELRNHFLNLI